MASKDLAIKLNEKFQTMELVIFYLLHEEMLELYKLF